MIAVKEAIGTPDRVFATMQIVDTIVPYVWMGMLVSCVSMQPMYDRWNRSDPRILDQLLERVENVKVSVPPRLQLLPVFGIVALGIFASRMSQFLANFLPEITGIISTYTWVIIIVSGLGLSLSLTAIKQLERFGSTRVGYFILYFVLASIGAKASLANIGSTLLLIVAGFLLVFIHMTVTVLVGLRRAFRFLDRRERQHDRGERSDRHARPCVCHHANCRYDCAVCLDGNAGQLCQYAGHV